MKIITIKSLLIAALLFITDAEAHAQTRTNETEQGTLQQNDNKRSNKRSRKANAQRVDQSAQPTDNLSSPKRGNQSPDRVTASPETTTGRGSVQPANNPGRTVAEPIQNTPEQNKALADFIRQIETEAQPVVQNVANGQINWTQQFIETTGQAIIDNERFKNPAQARLMAQRGAVVVAQRNLLEIIKGVHVTGETSVEDMATSYDYIYTRVDGVIKGAEQVGQAIEKDGYIEVRMRVPLAGNKGLADAVVDGARAMNQANARMSAPGIVGNVSDLIDGSRPLLFSMGGQQVSPSLFPQILDEAGNLGIDLSAIYNSVGNGNLPRYVQSSEELIRKIQQGNLADVVELVAGKNGMLQVSPKNNRKINWARIASIAGTVGRFIMML